MAIKKYKPTTPGRRGMTVTDYSVLSKVAPERSLLEPNKKHAGRNNTGKITVRHHGGGNRVKYRVIDFKRNKFDVPATVKTLEYDPNRSAGLFLIFTDRIENGWCQLEIEIIDMNHVRLKVVQHFPDLFCSLCRIENLERIP